ncbi:Munc13 homology 1 [Phaffia rhodozyma]|uniref:Munc13 homology 1 n=1 Tax=Phaffia rhodozyma TaxID=264483 RepID=A0A0F7SXG7_PHARH|nr:Munc13 homology 1 [Phaffia rhodozyma]
MSLHSTRSAGTGRTKGTSYRTINDATVYQYALRVAYLSYLMRPKPVILPPPEESSESNATDNSAPTRGHRERIQGALASATKMPDFTSMFMGGGSSSKSESKSSKFPEKTFKALDDKLRSIFMGKDLNFQDHRIRQTVAAFWSNTNDPSYLKGVKENRKIEELILMFVSVATKELHKEVKRLQDKNIEPDFDWKYELNLQVGQIVRILRDALKGVNGVSVDLLNKLDTYSSKLAATSTPRPTPISNHSHMSTKTTDGTNRQAELTGGAGNTTNPEDMSMVLVVGELFGKTSADLKTDILAIKDACNEKAAMVDLKTCLKNLNAGLPFPGRREDFDSTEAFNNWRQTEVTHLSQLVMIMVQFNPELAKQNTAPPSSSTTTPTDTKADRPASLYTDRPDSICSQFATMKNTSIRSVDMEAVMKHVGEDEEISSGGEFTFIPGSARLVYKRLIEVCIDFDLDMMANLPEDQEVTLSILSSAHTDLLNECAMRWRIGHPYRATATLDVMRLRYERDEIPLECLPEALAKVDTEMKKLPLEQWMWQDSGFLLQILNVLWEYFLRVLHFNFEDISKVKWADISDYVLMLEELRDTGLVGHSNADLVKLDQIVDQIRQKAFSLFSAKTSDLFSEEEDNPVDPLMMIIDWVEKQAKLFKKRFPGKILDAIDVVPIVLGQQVPLLLQDLEDAHPRLLTAALGSSKQEPVIDVDQVFGLYRRSTQITAMHDEYCPDSGISFDLGAYFEPFVRKWLQTIDGLTHKWVAEAIRVDNFEPEGTAGNSSSIVDLFGSFSSALDFLFGLDWPDQYQEARFLTSLSKTLSKVVDQYCNTIEELFLEEMFPRISIDPSVPKENAWIVKAKMTLQGEKKIEPFNFIPASCVKLNNIETARNELDEMYKKMQVDQVTRTIEEEGSSQHSTQEPSNKFLFTVKIVLAEGLTPSNRDSNSKLDTFVTLSDQHGFRLAKTRTVYETLDPRWNQTFDISVEKDLWLMATVRDRALIGKHDEIGRAYVRLDPRKYGDFLTHEVWYDLEEKTGRLLLRISMEGEKDEIGFYFGRAFRTLKRAESDMIRTFVDKMSPMIRENLTRGVIKTLIKSTATPIDYNEAINKLTGRLKSAIGTSNEPAIPLPKDELPPVPRPKILTDVEIEAAINPLFDYFDINQTTLSNSLSLTALQTVMTKLWKELLSTLESLLIPSLSAAPTDMTPLGDQEVDIVMKWRGFLRDYFHAQGDEKGLSLETLHNQKYNDLMSIRMHYDWSTDALMETSLRASGTMRRAKSVYHQKNLGTIRSKKKEKKTEAQKQSTGNADLILRILRMRPGSAVREFIAQQLEFKAMLEKQAQEARPQPLKRPSAAGPKLKNRMSRIGGNCLSIPPVPSIPSAQPNVSASLSTGSIVGYELRDN